MESRNCWVALSYSLPALATEGIKPLSVVLFLMKKPYRFDFQKLKLIYSKYNAVEGAVSSKERREQGLDKSIDQRASLLKDLKKQHQDFKKDVPALKTETENLESQRNRKRELLDVLDSSLKKTKSEMSELELRKEELDRDIPSKEAKLNSLQGGIRSREESISSLNERSLELNQAVEGTEKRLSNLKEDVRESEERKESLQKEADNLNSALSNKAALESQLTDIENMIPNSEKLTLLASLIEKPETLTQEKRVLLIPFSQILSGMKVYVNNKKRMGPFRTGFKSADILAAGLDRLIRLTEYELT